MRAVVVCCVSFVVVGSSLSLVGCVDRCCVLLVVVVRCLQSVGCSLLLVLCVACVLLLRIAC